MYQLLLLRMLWQKELVRNLLQDKLIKISLFSFPFKNNTFFQIFVSICSEIRHMEQFVWMEVRQLISGIRDLVQELTLLQCISFLRSFFGIDGYMGVYIPYQAIPRPNSQFIYFLNSYLHKISHLSILFQETPTCIHYSFI